MTNAALDAAFFRKIVSGIIGARREQQARNIVYFFNGIDRLSTTAELIVLWQRKFRLRLHKRSVVEAIFTLSLSMNFAAPSTLELVRIYAYRGLLISQYIML